MSTASAVEAAVPVKAGKKKLILVVAAALLVLAAAGGGALFWMKKQAQAAAEAAEEAEDGDGAAQGDAHAAAKRDPKAVPVFVSLDNFTVNLADREADRYAQIGISLELNDAKTAEQIKVFMPAIRNNILMVLSHKKSSDLLDRAGKEQFAAEVQRETERALGVEPPGPKKAAAAQRPIRAVHFANFIIQ